MENLAVIRDVSLTLRKLLFGKRISEISSENDIIFDSPALIDDRPEGNKASVFLYQVVINQHLRNIEGTPVGTDRMQRPPLAVDLLYLFTPYAKDSITELLMIEWIMRILHENAVLRGNMMQGKLVENGNDEIRIVPHVLTFEESNKLWERFPNKPFRLSVSYMLTPVRIPSATYDITRVVERDIDLYLIGGER